jgi:hypothetical protein
VVVLVVFQVLKPEQMVPILEFMVLHHFQQCGQLVVAVEAVDIQLVPSQ